MGEKSDAGMGKSGAQKIDGAVPGVAVNDDDFLRQVDPRPEGFDVAWDKRAAVAGGD
jgi:hypothetical protein